VPVPQHPHLLYGTNVGDDTGVFRLQEDLALVQTVDFFTPIVDDPFLFGQIAAANALSDIYTMGARPITALNLVSFPCKLGMHSLSAILQGGHSKVEEAGAVIVGGHSVDDQEPKYGLAITGVVDPRKMITNVGARPGQKLILTKKIGTGIISNMRKLHRGARQRLRGQNPISPETEQESMDSMVALNRQAAEVMLEFECSACTDISGFGLLGHARNVAEASNVGFELWVDRVPYFQGVLEVAVKGTAGGGHRNLTFVRDSIERASGVSDEYVHLLCDAQTSGGLLMSVDSNKADELVAALRKSGVPHAAIIGQVVEEQPGRLLLRRAESR
jgi:selenide,water dikinase